MAPVIELKKGTNTDIPTIRAGMRIGLLGGSFDPPHEGHMHISLEAIKRLKLHQLWWIVSPGNPLKEKGPWPLERRMQQCRKLANHPKLRVTAFETALGSPYTANSLKFLVRRFPANHFVWLMGADNMATVHLWRDWRKIFETMPVAIFDRPDQRVIQSSSMAAHIFQKQRKKEQQSAVLAGQKAPAWNFLSLPLNFQSSTRIRAKHRV